MKVLAGDVGGTKTLLWLAEVADCTCQKLYERRFDSQSFSGLIQVINAFLDSLPVTSSADIQAACFGVAGPVRAGLAKITNLPWQLDATDISEMLDKRPVHLINDFQAIGYGIEALSTTDVVTLQAGQESRRAPQAIIGAGTGLGEGYRIWQADHYEVYASEGGHVDFAPTDTRQQALLDFLQSRYERVTYERILSGPGLVMVYEFLQEYTGKQASIELLTDLADSDQAAVISTFALSGRDALAVAALDLFVEIYGSQAGNLALTCLATGGVFIAGGIVPQIIDKLRDGAFLDHFNDKGRMSDLTVNMPVKVIMNPKVGVMGAAVLARILHQDPG